LVIRTPNKRFLFYSLLRIIEEENFYCLFLLESRLIENMVEHYMIIFFSFLQYICSGTTVFKQGYHYYQCTDSQPKKLILTYSPIISSFASLLYHSNCDYITSYLTLISRYFFFLLKISFQCLYRIYDELDIDMTYSSK